MKTTTALVFLSLVLSYVSIVQALTIETVQVGNAGNAAGSTRYGAVSYNYRIGKYEVTNSQYSEFLNAVDPTGENPLGLYHSNMSHFSAGGINFINSGDCGFKYESKVGRDNHPVVWLSLYDAFRFANWLHNGQGNGDTETGSYTLLGATPIPSNAIGLARNPGATWFLPRENEWYKAAYHKNDGVTGNYWDYPIGSNTLPTAEMPPGGSNSANFGNAVGSMTDIGAYTLSESPYGTFDQGGNVWEYIESNRNYSFVTVRGSSWDTGSYGLAASFRARIPSSMEGNIVGFRVASIPEPSSLLLGTTAIMGLLVRRRSLR